MTKIYNKASMKSRRKYLRKNMPYPEQVLWKCLRSRKLKGYKFRRQVSIGKYIVDFYCPKLKLAIEIDGDSHFEERAIRYDKKRDKWIGDLGIKIIRFTNTDVVQNIEGVMHVMETNQDIFKS